MNKPSNSIDGQGGEGKAELLPCPFCGNEADVVTYGLHDTITCSNKSCACQIEGYDDVDSYQAWNSRVNISVKIKKQLLDLTYALGIQFGYPSCCINEFCTDLKNDENPGKKRNVDGSGFIPCSNHYKQVKSGEITLSSLIARAPDLLSQLNAAKEENERLKKEAEINRILLDEYDKREDKTIMQEAEADALRRENSELKKAKDHLQLYFRLRDNAESPEHFDELLNNHKWDKNALLILKQ